MTTQGLQTIEFDNLRDIDLIHIFECGQCFRWLGGGPQQYIGAAGDKAALATLDPSGGCLRLEVTGGDAAFWRSYFDLDTDYGRIKERLAAKDAGIKPALEYGSGIRILKQDPFETLISFIISQNNNIPRIRKNIESICERYGKKIEGSHLHAFPDAETLASAKLQDLMDMKLGYRAPYIIETAQKYIEDGCPSCRDELLGFTGVGPKVANCIMLFGLRDTAAFPIDTWVRHIMNDMYGFDEKDSRGMQAFAEEKFGDLAGYAQQYLFYYYREKR